MLSPSFNSYCNGNLAQVAARVVHEFNNPDHDFCFINQKEQGRISNLHQDEDEEFEFAFVARDSESFSPIPADEIFRNGQIRPIYPIFNKDLFLKHLQFENENRNSVVNRSSAKSPAIRLPLRELFIEERETMMTMNTSLSSSESDGLDGVAADTYCVWRPYEAAAGGRCKKSSSAGSNSKRWKFKDLIMNRSHSDGRKGSFVLLTPNNSSGRKQDNKTPPLVTGKVKSKAAAQPPRRSYLPDRQDLVGFFSNV